MVGNQSDLFYSLVLQPRMISDNASVAFILQFRRRVSFPHFLRLECFQPLVTFRKKSMPGFICLLTSLIINFKIVENLNSEMFLNSFCFTFYFSPISVSFMKM